MLSHFTVVRKLEGSIFPMGFTKEATDRNTKAGTNIISFESRQVQPTEKCKSIFSIDKLLYLCLHILSSLSCCCNLSS